MEQYNTFQDINLQIQGATTYDFKLRVVFPQAPRGAIGMVGQKGLVYPNDEIEMSVNQLSFSTLGYLRERISIKGLNEYGTADNIEFYYRTHPNSSRRHFGSWEKPKNACMLETGDIKNSGAKVQIITPKGSFTVTFV